MGVALRTLSAHGGGGLVVSGHGGEAERLAALAPSEVPVTIEPTARSTQENVERSLPHLVGAEMVSIASDRFQRRRAVRYLSDAAPELGDRLVDPAYGWRVGWWMDAAGGLYEVLLRVRYLATRRSRR